MAQSARSDFDSLSLKYGITKQYDWLGSITEWKVLEGALEELHVSKLDQADFNVLWSTHQVRKQGKRKHNLFNVHRFHHVCCLFLSIAILYYCM
jgi:hypothetical protein